MRKTLTSDKYAELGGTKCPVCNGEDFDCGKVQVDVGGAFQKNTCCICNSSWTDEYILTGYSELEVKENA